MFTALHSFDYAEGANPHSGMVQHTDGAFYGAALGGDENGDGVIYRLVVGLRPFVALAFNQGARGSTVQILGQDFSGTTAVYFNGFPAKFEVESSTFLTAVVPASASSGIVTVTTSSGTFKSNRPFIVN